MTQTISQKEQAIVTELDAISNWRDRYRRIINIGRELPDLDEDLKIEKYKVKGCQSQVWLVPEFRDGKVCFQADSDAAIVRGLVAIVLKVYSGHEPDEILASQARFVDELGLSEHLSQTRSNGLAAMLKQLRMYAFAMKAMAG